MATAYGAKDYMAIQKRRIAKLKQGKRRGPITAAKYMVAQMRSMVPVASGEMAKSIKRRKSTTEVRGSNPYNAFPYLHWVNATKGMGLEKVAYKERWGDDTKYAYKDVSGKTGTPGFYFISLKRTQKVFRNAMIDALHKSLRAEF